MSDSTPTPGEIDGLVDEVLRLDGEAIRAPWIAKTQEEWDEGFDFFAGPDGAFLFPVGADKPSATLITTYRAAAPALARALQTERAQTGALVEQAALARDEALTEVVRRQEVEADLVRIAYMVEHRVGEAVSESVKRALQAERAEVQHLRSVLDAAPHGRVCSSQWVRWACPDHGTDTLTADRRCAGCDKPGAPLPDLPCDCWKASALSKGGTEP